MYINELCCAQLLPTMERQTKYHEQRVTVIANDGTSDKISRTASDEISALDIVYKSND